MAQLKITPSENYSFGCRIDGADIARGIDADTYRALEDALHTHQVVCVSGEPYGHQALVDFGSLWGPLEVSVAKSFHHNEFPQVTVLSNQVVDGKPQGSADAGQMWHTDMSYNRIAGRASILHSHQVPTRDGVPLGDTAFRDMYGAYEQLPQAMRDRLDKLEAVHEFEKIWSTMIARGSARPPYTDAQRAEKPPVVHPVVLRHPWTGRKALYVNRGLTQSILGLPAGESDDLLHFLFDYQERPEFEFRHQWRVGDTLIWDNCATIHLATGGYDRTQPRVMIRVQVLGDAARYQRENGRLGGRVLAHA